MVIIMKYANTVLDKCALQNRWKLHICICMILICTMANRHGTYKSLINQSHKTIRFRSKENRSTCVYHEYILVVKMPKSKRDKKGMGLLS